jgi:serine/threonine protein kinase
LFSDRCSRRARFSAYRHTAGGKRSKIGAAQRLAVDDPHIIPVYEAGEADGTLFIAMRCVAGGDVHSLVHRAGPLAPDRAVAIISPVASALDAAHAAGLVHRDVKSANMLLDARPGGAPAR